MMKTGIVALGALSLLNLVAAQPSNHRRHQQLHDKRQDVVVDVEYTYVTKELPKVIVFVDENNNPYSTSTEGQAPATSVASTSAATSVSIVSSSSAPAFTIDTKVKDIVNPTTASSSSATTMASVYIPITTSSSAPTTSSSAAASSKAPSSGGGYGMVYSPYNIDRTCKTQDEVNADFAAINSWAQSNGENWNLVRSYGADCKQVAMMISAAKQYGVQIFAGVYNVMNGVDAFTNELNDLITQVNGDWSMIHTISFGNEVINNGQMTVDDMKNIMSIGRGMLSGKYSGSIVAVDTFIAMLTHREELCDLSDYPAVNAHPFFDVLTSAETAGAWVLLQMQLVSAACGGKDTWITETGWPTQGYANGAAVPGVSQQKAALASIKSSVSSNTIMLSAFNTQWKEDNPSTFGAEKWWGICDA